MRLKALQLPPKGIPHDNYEGISPASRRLHGTHEERIVSSESAMDSDPFKRVTMRPLHYIERPISHTVLCRNARNHVSPHALSARNLVINADVDT